MLRIVTFLLVTFLLGCTPSSPQSEAFFKNLEAAFTPNAEAVFMVNVTDFAWEDVCIFKADSPYPYVGYESYKEYVTAKELNGTLPHEKYGLIFMFLNKGKVVREYFQTEGYLTIANTDRTLELASKKPFIKFCSTADGLAFSLDPASSSILISKQRPE